MIFAVWVDELMEVLEGEPLVCEVPNQETAIENTKVECRDWGVDNPTITEVKEVTKVTTDATGLFPVQVLHFA